MTNTKQPNSKTEYADQHFENLSYERIFELYDDKGSRELWLAVNEFREKWEHIREEQ